MKLYNAKHSYCTEGCYYSNDCHESFESWADFLEEWGDADDDYNLLFRWDWSVEEPVSKTTESGERPHLVLFYMLQRKACPRSVRVYLSRKDEPVVRAFLESKWKSLKALWAPVSGEKPAKLVDDNTIEQLGDENC